MNLKKLNKQNESNFFITEKLKNDLNLAVQKSIRKQRSYTADFQSKKTIGSSLRDAINSTIKESEKNDVNLKYKNYRNSSYYLNNDCVLLYRRNSYYINEKKIKDFYNSAKKFILDENERGKQLEFHFDSNVELCKQNAMLKNNEIYLFLLEFNLDNLNDELDNPYYELYFITISNGLISNCTNITIKDTITKVYDASNSVNDKYDEESKLPEIEKTIEEIRKNTNN